MTKSLTPPLGHVSIADAALLTRRTRAAILKAIRTGHLAAVKSGPRHTDPWFIELKWLDEAYPRPVRRPGRRPSWRITDPAQHDRAMGEPGVINHNLPDSVELATASIKEGYDK